MLLRLLLNVVIQTDKFVLLIVGLSVAHRFFFYEAAAQTSERSVA